MSEERIVFVPAELIDAYRAACSAFLRAKIELIGPPNLMFFTEQEIALQEVIRTGQAIVNYGKGMLQR